MASIIWSEKKHMVIDFGTSETRVYIEGAGVIFNEPSVIAVNIRTKKVIAIGNEAKKQLGKLNKNVRVHTLQSNGAIVDIRLVVTFLAEILKRHTEIIKKCYVTLACPSGLTSVEKSALMKAIKSLGVFYVDAQDSIKLGLFGAGVDITNSDGRIALDLGAGKIAIAAINLDEVVLEKQSRYAGNLLDHDIIKELKNKQQIAIGELTAEKIKNTIGTVLKTKKELKMKIYGYNVESMLPYETEIKEDDVREVIKKMTYQITSLVSTLLEELPTDFAESTIKNGIVIFGNLAKIVGLKVYFEDFFEVPITIAKNCGTAVIDGGIKYKTITQENYIMSISKKQETTH